MNVRRSRWLLLVLALVLAAGCSTLPVDGDVHSQPDTAAEDANQAPYFAPPGPETGADRESIVRGFLLATQANPPSTSVARSFLSERAKIVWKPVGTTVYDGLTLDASNAGVRARLTAAHDLDDRGGWLGGSASRTLTYPYSLVLENGEWRIDNPPTSLPVPAPYFRSLFVPFTLYFFDRTGTVLVPSRVYLPLGEQVASNLVRGLLAGPGGTTAAATTSAFPPGAVLDLSVVVNDDGIAEVPLGPRVQRMSPADLYRAVVQLAWTLRQVPGLTRLRVTVDGTAIPLVNGQTDVNVDTGSEYDPVVAPDRDFVALLDGRVVTGDDRSTKPVGGPFGAKGFALRSVARSVSRGQVAAVSTSGRRLYVGPDDGSAAPARARTVLQGANLLRPAYDRFGGLWVVDAARSGAVVHLLDGTRDRVVDVRGITGRRVTSFTVTRDGASLVAGLSAGPSPTLVVSSLVRDGDGRLTSAGPGRRIVVESSDRGPVRDVGQDSATTVAILTQPATGSGQVLSVELDGSPGVAQPNGPDPVPGQLAALVSSPDPSVPLRVVTSDGRFLELAGSGEWTKIASAVTGAAYPQ
ncbi:MAG: LpqB family beta-propeller domain-containing protein [Marmoricola sp.]